MVTANQESRSVSCFLCEGNGFSPHMTSKRFGFPLVYRKCNCGVISQHPLPSKEFYHKFFNSELFQSSKRAGSDETWGFYDFFADERCRMLTSRVRMRMFKSFFSGPGSSILKVGPATGTLLKLAMDAGHEARGCDLSETFSEFAKKNYGVEIDVGRFEDLPYPDDHYDCILALSIWENIPDPLDFMRVIRKKIKPGGFFILNYVNMTRNIVASLQRDRYFLYRPPVAHIYTDRTMHRLAEKCGFTVERKLPDIRFMHLEKILSTLSWNFLLRTVQRLKIAHIPLPIPAYPSKILVLRRADGVHGG